MKKPSIAILLSVILIILSSAYSDTQNNHEQKMSCVKFPVVNNTNGGRVIDACSMIVPGDGSIFININDTRIDEYLSQTEIKRAVNIAYNFSGRERENDDVMIHIRSGGTIIRGNSMGAAVCATVIGAINGYELRDDVALTGTIREYGRIGNVSMVAEKTNSSKRYGMNAIIVPKGKRYQNGTDMGSIMGIEVIEAENISEAMTHIIQ